MKFTTSLIGLTFLACFIIQCHQRTEASSDVYSENIFGKEVSFSNIKFTSLYSKDITYQPQGKHQLVFYLDSTDCVRCKFKTYLIKDLIMNMDSLTRKHLDLLFIFQTADEPKLKHFLQDNGFTLPFGIDNGDFFITNKIPKNEETKCFLIDSHKHIMLIGNPFQNVALMDLYIRTIKENINSINNKESNRFHIMMSKDLGTFNWNKMQETTIIVSNNQKQTITIDSVYTSCDCTTASIDKTEIQKGDSAIISVTFKADKPEQFMREIYVKIRGEEAERVYTIEGEAIDEEQ